MVITKQLNCGATIVMEKITYVKSVAMGIFVEAGAVDETPEHSGISHYIEHMMFKGTAKRNAKQIAEEVDRIAGNMNAYTSKEHTCYHIKTLSENADKAIEIITDMFMNSLFDSEEMKRERNVIYEEMSMIEDTPDDLAYETATTNVFAGNPLAKSIIGTRTSLKHINHDVMMDYKQREYTADRTVISVVGNFDEDTVCELFDKYMSGMTKTKPIKTYTEIPHTPKCSVKVKEIEQSHIMLAARNIALGDDLYYAQMLLSNAFGGTMSSRLFQNVREQKGLAYSVYTMQGSYKSMGSFMIYAGVSHSNIHKAVDAIKEELERLNLEGLTEDELSMSKEQLKGNYIYGLENVNGRMLGLGKNMLILRKVFTPEEVIRDIENVNMDDIRACINKIGDIHNYSAALVSNHRAKFKEMLW